MTVPFEDLGPGQKGRLTYQVMGDGGPIPNPKKIRYLPPDQVLPASMNPVGPSMLGGALATTQTILQAAEFGDSIHNAIKLREIEAHLSKVLKGLEQIKAQFDSISERLDLIIQKVDAVQKMEAEKDMRSDLKYILKEKHVAEESVNLSGLATDVLEIIGRYEEVGETNIQLGGERSLRISVETKDLLTRIFRLFHTVRRSAYTTVNREASGDPVRAVEIDLQEDYWPSEVASYDSVLLAIRAIHWVANERGVRDYVDDHVTRVFNEADPVAMRLRPFFYEMDANLERKAYEAFRKWWVWKGDAGLLHRVRKEARGIAEGYASTFDLDTQALPDHEQGDLFCLAAPNDQSDLQKLTSEFATSPEPA